jgi:AraC family transcriptional regulator of arabinose operon
MEPRIYKAILLMTYDLNREIPLDELARSVNLSTSRLRHLFKDETGLSPAQYMKSQRLLRAKFLLETTFLNLKEIMHKSGLRDRSHFTRDFSKAYGLPPLQYRKQHLEEEQMTRLQPIAKSATR